MKTGVVKMVRKLHRWLGLAFSLCVLAAAGSGVLHNVMTATQSAPPPARPGGEGMRPEQLRISPAAAAAALPGNGSPIEAISIRLIKGRPWYQFYLGNEARAFYVSAADGKAGPEQDELYAEEIASAYLGGIPVKKGGYLTAYDSEYIAIFRILPVYRFEAGDGRGTRVYVSTITGSVTRHTDNAKQFEADAFSLFHKYMFIPDRTWRNAALTATTSAVALVALLGVVLFWKTKR